MRLLQTVVFQEIDNLEEMDKLLNCKTCRSESRWSRGHDETDHVCKVGFMIVSLKPSEEQQSRNRKLLEGLYKTHL